MPTNMLANRSDRHTRVQEHKQEIFVATADSQLQALELMTKLHERALETLKCHEHCIRQPKQCSLPVQAWIITGAPELTVWLCESVTCCIAALTRGALH